MKASFLLTGLLGAGVALASRCKPSSSVASPSSSASSLISSSISIPSTSSPIISSSSTSSRSSVPISFSSSVSSSNSVSISSSSSTISSSSLSAPSSSPVPSSSSSSVPSSSSSAPPAASSSSSCTNLFANPDFSQNLDSWDISPDGDNIIVGSTIPCGDKASCAKVGMGGDDLVYLHQVVNFPYTGHYAASVQFLVQAVAGPFALIAFVLNGNAVPLGNPTSVDLSTVPINVWQTLTVDVFGTAGTGNSIGVYLPCPDGDSVTVLVTDVQIIACK